MCGISGVVNRDPMGLDCLVAMSRIVRHRGPDDEGYAVFAADGVRVLGGADTPENVFTASIEGLPRTRLEIAGMGTGSVAFGHRRLSIIDLSPLGHQPMVYAGRYWITYNGEVFNYRELRVELEAAGHSFRSHSDTEIILAAYAHWGAACVSHFIGMWAFAIYDTQDQTLFLARDRFGVKPFYYTFLADGFFAFASEIKQFTLLPGWRSRLNGQRAYDFLAWSITDHTEETLFAGVYQVPPGCCGTFQIGQLQRTKAFSSLPWVKWYDLPIAPYRGSFADAAAEFREKFFDAVRLRLRSDVPVGSCLSGGLDSSSIVVVANTLLRESGDSHQQLTFSASAEDSRYDEMGWADMVTAKTGVQSHKVCPKLSDLFEASKAITWHQDEPFASTSIYAQWRVFELAANAGVKVMLDGQGADEQLAGYHGFFSPYLASLWKTAKFSELLAEMSTLRSMHGYSSVRSLQFLLDAILPNALRQQGRRLLGRPHANPHWLSLAALNAEPIDPFLAWRGTASPDVQTYSIAQMKSSQLQMLLHWEDRDSMAHSIESRVPFLDHRLVEFVVGLPDAYKLQGGVTKRVLREGMTGLLPEPVRMRRDKVGFATPEDVWMRTASNEFVKRADWAIETAGGILKAEAKTHVRKIINGSERFSSTPWRMICFAEWLQTYAVK